MDGDELRVVEGNARGRTMRVDDELIIGRAADEPGRLADDRELSRRHARFVRDADGRLTIEDLGSTNGTFVNGVRVCEPQPLKAGDVVRVGGTTLELTASDVATTRVVADRPAPRTPRKPRPAGDAPRDDAPRDAAPRDAAPGDAAAPDKAAGRRRRPVVRFVTSVMVVSGILLLADAAATLLWQEPISYATSIVRQNSLESALADAPRRVREGEPLKGDAIGRIELPTLGRKYFIVEGTDTGDLRKGPGHYADTPLPGQGGTVGIAGHRTTHGAPFRTIDQLKPGDEIIVDMTNGTFVYSVERTRIVDPTETSVKRPVGHEQLILSACHPLYSAAQRIVVFARLVRKEPARVG